MEHFSTDQKIAMLVVPVMLFGMLGVSYAPAYGRTLSEEEETAPCLSDVSCSKNERSEGPSSHAQRIREALEKSDLDAFKHAVEGTPYAVMATEPFFTELVRMYTLHVSGAHNEADAHLSRLLYDA